MSLAHQRYTSRRREELDIFCRGLNGEGDAVNHEAGLETIQASELLHGSLSSHNSIIPKPSVFTAIKVSVLES